WQAICAKVLPLFNGEGLKGSIEDLNELVSEMLMQQINPSTDLKELLAAGMLNLGNRIVTVGDEALILRLVELWSFFFGTVVPYVQECSYLYAQKFGRFE
ncbi:HbrB-like protein, partial [Chytridium lagenaria]